MSDAPAKEVWVVFGGEGAEFVATYRQAAMEHAAELAGGDITSEFGPYRVARYVAEPFAFEKALPVIEAARALSDSLNGGFVRCSRCGDQEDTTDLDFAADLRVALAAHDGDGDTAK